jgi:hypothetical protein
VSRYQKNGDGERFGLGEFFCTDRGSTVKKGGGQMPKENQMTSYSSPNYNTREQIRVVQDKLNHRAHKILGFKLPFEVFYGTILETS